MTINSFIDIYDKNMIFKVLNSLDALHLMCCDAVQQCIAVFKVGSVTMP